MRFWISLCGPLSVVTDAKMFLFVGKSISLGPFFQITPSQTSTQANEETKNKKDKKSKVHIKKPVNDADNEKINFRKKFKKV